MSPRERSSRPAGCRRALPLLSLALIPLALAALPARAAIAPDAAPLLDRHVAWLGGWPALDAVDDLSLAGTIEVAGLKGALDIRLRRDGRQRLDFDLKVMSGTETVDGDDAWARNPSGQIEDLGVEKVTAARRNLDRAFNRHLRGEGVEVTRQPDETRDGRAWAVLRFAYPDGDLYDLLVDAATGESVWSRETSDGRVTWAHSLDLRVVDGRRLAYRQETLAEQALENQTVTWSTITVNAGLGDDVFGRPGAAPAGRLFTLPAGASATAWLPVELLFERYIMLRGRVGGVETDILLDSGAGMTVLDEAFAKKLGLESSGALPAQGVGGTTTAGLVQGVTLELGDLKLGPMTAVTLDLSQIAGRMGRDLPVILGKEVFHALVVDMDYPNARIRFLDPENYAYDGQGHRLEVMPADDGHKLVKLAVEGLPEASYMLDTGQGGALTMFRKYTDDNRLLEARRQTEVLGGGVGGMIKAKMARLRTVDIAGYRLTDVPAAFQRQDVGGAFDTARLAGNLGAGILNRFRVTFDYSRDCLWLEPGAAFGQPLPQDRLGLNPHPEGGALVVDHVCPGSPAEAAGWKAGDRITALDGQPVGADWWKVLARWSRLPSGTKVRLTGADGGEREVELADYY